MLEIRRSSGLFRLRTGPEIEKRVTFENTGPFQVPGVVAMRIDGCTDPSGLSPADGALMVIINASDDPRTLGYYPDETWNLHPVQAASADPVVRTARHDASGFFVPARTTAVFRRAAQTSCAPYPRELFVRGVNGDWSDNPDRRLVFLGGVDYSATFPVNAGAQQFKVADSNWTGDTNCGAPGGGLTARLGVPAALYCANDSGNIGLAAPVAGDYTFSLDATDTASPLLTVEKTPPTPLTLFVRGITGDWSANPARALTWDGTSRYQVVIDGLPANAGQQFKVADNDWGGSNNGATNCGAGASPTVTPGTPYALNCSNSSGNLEITFPTAGSWLFSVDATNPAAWQLTVEKTPVDVSLFLRGLQNDWSDGAQNLMRYVGAGEYRTSKILAAGADDFKIADSGWTAATNCGASTAVQIGTPLPLDCSSNSGNIGFTAPAPGSYVFSLKYGGAAPELTVSGP
jgi:pullulanase